MTFISSGPCSIMRVKPLDTEDSLVELLLSRVEAMNAVDGNLTGGSQFGTKQAEFRAFELAGKLADLSWDLFVLVLAWFFFCCVLALANGNGAFIHLVVFGMLFLAGGIALLVSIRAAGRTCVEVYEDGLVLRQQSHAQQCRWEEIVKVIEKEAVDGDEVISEGLRSESRAFHLHLRSGKVIMLKSYLRAPARLGTTVKRETLPFLLPAYQEILQMGECAQFGPICVHRNGITVQEQTLLWVELQRDGASADGSCSIAAGTGRPGKKSNSLDVPNSHVLMQIVCERCSG